MLDDLYMFFYTFYFWSID